LQLLHWRLKEAVREAHGKYAASDLTAIAGTPADIRHYDFWNCLSCHATMLPAVKPSARTTAFVRRA
jgi:hypothetical protein